LISKSPDADDVLTNWGSDRQSALRAAVDAIMDRHGPNEYREAMESYGSDKPELRYDLKIKNVTDWAKATDFKVFREAEYVRALVIPGGDAFTRKEIDDEFTSVAKRAKAKGLAWMKYVDGKFDGTIVKFFNDEQLSKLSELENIHSNCIVFFVADSYEITCKALGAVRLLAGEKLQLADPNTIAWAWIVDFPFYEENDGKVDFAHNPFSMPQGGFDAINNKTKEDVVNPFVIENQNNDTELSEIIDDENFERVVLEKKKKLENLKEPYLNLLLLLYKGGEIVPGDTLPSYVEFQNIIPKNQYTESQIKSFLTLCNYLNIFKISGTHKVALKSYGEAINSLNNYLNWN
jgi:hypothetical protein